MGGRNPDQRRRRRRLAGAQGRHQLTVVGTFKRRPGNIFDPHAGHSIAFEFKKFSGPVGDINEPVTVVRAPVIDADDQRFAVAKVGHPGITGHREGRMGGGQRSHVEHFAIGSEPAMEIIAIPGGWKKRRIWDRPCWQTCPMRRSWREQGMRPPQQHPAPSVTSDLTAESPYAPIPFHRPRAYFNALGSCTPRYSPTQHQTKDIATRTRRKWGEYTRMMNRWLLWHAVDLRPRWI